MAALIKEGVRRPLDRDIEYNLRGVIGFLTIIAGMAGSIWLGWWLGSEGDVIETLKRMKAALPGWGWRLLKYGLSSAFAALSALVFVSLGMLVLRGRRK